MRELGIFNFTTIERMVDHHQSGRRDYSAPLWSLLMFESSLKRLRGLRPRVDNTVPV